MKNKGIMIKTLQLITIILLYHISGENSLFLYASSLSLYNIFLPCFEHITLKETFEINKYNKQKILKKITLNIIIIWLFFILISIFIGDAINIFLNIKNTFLPYLIMSLSIITEPIIRILLEYLESYKKPKLSNSLLKTYYIIEYILLLIISIVTIYLAKLPIHISIALLYLSKIISFSIISLIAYLNIKKINIDKSKKREEIKINYKKEVRNILTTNSQKSIITLIKNSYYYISIILLYFVLSNRYGYDLEIVEKNIAFIYLYGIFIINFIIDIIITIIPKKGNIINYIYTAFEKNLTIAIIIGITSPLICQIVFLSSDNSIYIMMLSFLSIFIILYNITFDYIKNNKIIYISLIIGILSKIILTIPLIDAIYRMGYNLIYGDIISTIISISISIIINYIYIKRKNKNEKTLEKILKLLYESILLCIVLVLLQFIIPIKNKSYIETIFTFIIYVTISIICIRLKKKKRG